MRIQGPQLLFPGIVLASLVMHGFVLQMPWREHSVAESDPSLSTDDIRTEAIEKDPQAIAITALPNSSPSPQRQTAQSSTSAQPQTIPQPFRQLDPPAIQVEPPPIQAPLDPVSAPAPAQPAPDPPPIEVLPTEPPNNPPPESPTAPSEPNTDRPEPTQPPEPEHGMVVPLGDRFPHFQNSESGCYGLENCHRIAGEGTYRQAGKKLVEQMKADGFQVEARDDVDEQGHRVFAIVSPDEPETTYFLNVFSDDSDSTVYAITLEIVSLAQLQKISSKASR